MITPDVAGHFNQITHACGWGNSYTATTADYFLSTATNTDVGIPCNLQGNQNYQFDDGYAGLLGISTGGAGGQWKEAIESNLNNYLTAGDTYEVPFYLSLNDLSLYNSKNCFGLHFQEPQL